MRTFDALRYHRDYRFLLASNFLHSVTNWMQMLVKTWLVYEITGSVFMVAMYTAARMAPHLLGPFAGVLADRVSRKKLVIVVRVLAVVCALALAVLLTTDSLEFWHLAVIGFVQGVIMSGAMTGGGALVMDIVGKEHLTNALAFNTISMDVTRIIGPAVGGLLLAAVGAANVFWISIGVAATSVISLFFIHPPAQTRAPGRESVLQNLTEGFRYVIHSRDMFLVLFITFIYNIFLAPIHQSFMPVFAKDNLGQGPMGLGFLQTSMGVGALISAIFIASLGDFSWKGKMYLYGTALYAVLFGSFALTRSFPLALGLVGLAGLASTSFGAMQRNLTLILAPEDMRGRALGFLNLAIGALLFGSLLIGVAANAVGVGLASAISCGILAVALIAIGVVFPNLRRMR